MQNSLILSTQKGNPVDRRWFYPIALAIVLSSWATYMTISNSWGLYTDYWQAAATMLFGSFVAGSTPQGGAAVAFPVFTKVLQISGPDSRTFGFMIQAVGMSMASMMILAKRIRFLPRVVLWVTLGSVIGTTLGTFLFILPDPYPRILFTLGAVAFAGALIISRWVLKVEPKSALPDWGWRYGLLFTVVGVVGGVFSAQTGSGADMITFIVLTLAFGIHEKISTPTTVMIMALNSIFGFFLHSVVVQDVGLVWNYWLVAVPVVAVGAPLGAYVLSLIPRDVLIKFILFLIGAEFLSTVLLITFTSSIWTVTAVVLTGCTIAFWIMLNYRQKRIATLEMAPRGH